MALHDFAYASQVQSDNIESFEDIQILLPKYIHDYFTLRRKLKPATKLAYIRDIKIFLEFLQKANPALNNISLKEFPLSVIDQLTKFDMIEFENWEKRTAQEDIIERRFTALNGLFKWLSTERQISHNPMEGVERTRSESSGDTHIIKRMTAKETSKFLNTVQTGDGLTSRQKKYNAKSVYRDNAIVTLMLNTGVRVSELVGIDLDKINFDNSSIIIFRKESKEQIIYFNDEVKTALLDYIHIERDSYHLPPNEKALFVSNRHNIHTRLTVRSVEKLVKKYSLATRTQFIMTPHGLRKTFGTRLYNETGDIRLTADALGHRRCDVTQQHYSLVEEENRKKAGEMQLFE